MVSVDLSRCDSCGTCIAVCPADALSIADRVAVDPGRCTGCGRCVKVCPFGALSLPSGKDRPRGETA